MTTVFSPKPALFGSTRFSDATANTIAELQQFGRTLPPAGSNWQINSDDRALLKHMRSVLITTLAATNRTLTAPRS